MPTIHEALIVRIKNEYLEMPGLQLTHSQARRLWTLDDATCSLVLRTLVARNFLVRGSDAQYRRASDGISVERRRRTVRVVCARRISARTPYDRDHSCRSVAPAAATTAKAL